MEVYSNVIEEIKIGDLDFLNAYNLTLRYEVNSGICALMDNIKSLGFLPLGLIITIATFKSSTGFLYPPPWSANTIEKILDALQWRLDWLKKKQWKLL